MKRFLILLIFVLSVCFTVRAEARKLALLVGINKYEEVPKLHCCVNDVKALREALLKVGFEENDIQVLTTDGNSLWPTKKKIERTLQKIFDEAGPKDLVFISFSGHGAQDGEKVYFCPPDVEVDDLDGTCVSITKVMEDLATCKAKFKWVVVDACRNDPTQRSRGIGGKGLQTIPAPPEGITLFQSCAKGEESWEDPASGNGYFTKNLVTALSGEADMDHDGKLTLMEVCKWTISQTKEQVRDAEKKSQRPFFSGSVTDFTLTEDLNVPKAKALAAEAQAAMEAENYALAIEKYDKAIALYSRIRSWKRERASAQKLLEKEQELQDAIASTPNQPTSRDSFEWSGTTIKKFIGKETKVVIPKGTTEIGDKAFSGCSSLTSVVIPDSVTKIGDFAFFGCSSLTSVVIPEGVTKIGDFAFRGFSSLASVVIPDSVQEIDMGAFAGCTALKQWSISANHPYFKTDGTGLLTKDRKRLITCLASATEYRIPEGVTEIGDYTFDDCSSLTSVVIPQGVTKIGDFAFSGCSSLTSVEIPEGVTKIGNSTFEGCSSLTSVIIPKSVAEIGYRAFSDCNSLTSVVIHEGVTEIGILAFSDCSSLTSVVIPESVTEIAGRVFEKCPKLTIHGVKGSKAERYAKENNIPFEVR